MMVSVLDSDYNKSLVMMKLYEKTKNSERLLLFTESI